MAGFKFCLPSNYDNTIALKRIDKYTVTRRHYMAVEPHPKSWYKTVIKRYLDD